MTLNVTQLHGVSEDIAAKLRGAGLTDSEKLVNAVGQPAARKLLAQKLSIEERSLLELGNRADLARIKGIGTVYSDLLEYAGVDTVAELATRVPANLYAKIHQVAVEHHVIRPPTLKDVESWVSQAKGLDRKLYY